MSATTAVTGCAVVADTLESTQGIPNVGKGSLDDSE